ncbi:MAG TPA: hypothetical protein VM867_10925 [Xanthobacteraceae bacterium]|jgi:hypothetical protein|nr:hypothetical protein [Xanthobacteraceae bacterium]
MATAAIGQFESDLSALDACVERAGAALGCCYSSADEFEAEKIAEFRERLVLSRHAGRARVVLSATAVTSLAALLLLVI